MLKCRTHIPAVTFCFLKPDWIRAFHAGALPSFATCIALTQFECSHNQFTGAYSRVSTDRSVVVSYPTYPPLRSCFSKLIGFAHITRRRAAVFRNVHRADGLPVLQQPVQRCVNRLACVPTDRCVCPVLHPDTQAVVFFFLKSGRLTTRDLQTLRPRMP